MTNQSMTFEQIDAGINKLDLAAHQAAMSKVAQAAAANPALALPNLCNIYKAVRPILDAASNFPLIPPTWRAAIKALIGVLDTLCPQS